MLKRIKFIIIPLFFIYKIGIAQEIPVGSWRNHFSFREASILASDGDRLYCSTRFGLYFLDLTDNSINYLSKLDGLSDVGISAMKVVDAQGSLMVGYSNGNIDIIQDKTIININDLADPSLPFIARRINDIDVLDNLAYLSVDFGVVVVDLKYNTIKESYIEIGPGASTPNVKAAAFYNDSIYLATNLGILAASLNTSINKQDFNSWQLDTVGIGGYEFVDIEQFGDLLVAQTNQDTLYAKTNSWTKYQHQASSKINGIDVSENTLLISQASSILSIRNEQEDLLKNKFDEPYSSVMVKDKLWVADNELGLISGDEMIVPNGPQSDNVGSLYYDGTNIVMVGGNHETEGSAPLGYSMFNNGLWKVINKSTDENFPNVFNILSTVGKEQRMFATIAQGVLVKKSDGTYIIYNETNSTLNKNRKDNASVICTDVQESKNGGYWALNYDTGTPIQFLDLDGNWNSFTILDDYISYPLEVKEYSNGDLWLRLDPGFGGGIAVFDPESTLLRRLQAEEGLGGLLSSKVTAMEVDREGNIWMGFDNGVAYYPNPGQVLEQSKEGLFYALDPIKPILENRYLLDGEYITCIEIDGGNRKWIGTRNGLWLISEFGEELFANFRSDNSPLPSNEILDVEINDETGEVFIATSKGVVSYRGDATEGSTNHDNVKVFPNPVLPGYRGSITISGLVTDAIVKIVDEAGNMVYQAQAYGGTMNWNLTMPGEGRAHSGVYMVFSVDELGGERYVGKFAVVN